MIEFPIPQPLLMVVCVHGTGQRLHNINFCFFKHEHLYKDLNVYIMQELCRGVARILEKRGQRNEQLCGHAHCK